MPISNVSEEFEKGFDLVAWANDHQVKTGQGLQGDFDQAMSELNSAGGKLSRLAVEAVSQGQEALAQYCRGAGQKITEILSQRPTDDQLFPEPGGGTTYQYGSQKTASSFTEWLDTYLEESQLPYASWDITGPDGTPHMIDSDVVIEAIKSAGPGEQAQIKDKMVQIDFANGDMNDFFKHLAEALVQNYGTAF